MKYYMAINSYSTKTSVGFASTWGVYAYRTRADREKAYDAHKGLGIRKIRKNEISKYLNNRPKPFTSQFLGIVWHSDTEGHIEVCSDGDYGIDRLY